MYIIDITNRLQSSENIDRLVSRTEKFCSKIYSEMDSSDTIWIFTINYNTNGSFEPLPMRVAESIRSEVDLYLRDIITVYSPVEHSGLFRSTYEEILLLVKDKDEYQFDKDELRVDPIYEGEEWNGDRKDGHSAYRNRTTKRYNPDGKDPGNVWIEENRTETQSNVLDQSNPFSRKEAIQRCVRAGTDEKEIVSTLWAADEMVSMVKSEDRKIKKNSSDVYT